MAALGTGAMRDEDWRSLTSAIAHGTCILMLGPEAFVADFDGETLPVAVGLARWGPRGEAEGPPRARGRRRRSVQSGAGTYRVVVSGYEQTIGDFQLTRDQAAALDDEDLLRAAAENLES
jgi:hypothetical protein